MPDSSKRKAKPKIQFKTEEQAERFVKAAQEAEVDETALEASRRPVPTRKKPPRKSAKSGRSR